MDACHHGCCIANRFRHRQLQLLKLAGSIIQVELIEYAVLPVLGQCRPIPFTEVTTLGKQPAQISPFSNLIAVHSLINSVAAHLIVAVAYRHHIDTLARL